MSNAGQPHRRLQVWNVAIDFAVKIYRLTEKFPKKELYGLSAQLCRAAESVPANIAEGHSRSSTKEYLHFISIATGSLSEIDTHLEIARRLKYCDPKQIDECDVMVEQIARMLYGLRNALRKKLNDGKK